MHEVEYEEQNVCVLYMQGFYLHTIFCLQDELLHLLDVVPQLEEAACSWYEDERMESVVEEAYVSLGVYRNMQKEYDGTYSCVLHMRRGADALARALRKFSEMQMQYM